MTSQEELEKVRSEASDLRRRIAIVERAWQSQKKRADEAEQRATTLAEKVQELDKENRKKDEEIATLKARLAGVTLHKDKLAGMLFKTTANKKTDPPVRHIGGQVGHAGHGRKKPTRTPDEERHAYLSHCPTCESPVSRSNNSFERIVEDVVVPAVTKITKYTIERQWCSICRKEVRSSPEGTLPGFRLGTRALTLILFLKYRLRLPLELIAESLNMQYRLSLTEGAMAHTLQQLSKKLTPEYRKIVEEMRDGPVKHADETSWRINGSTGWCWAFLTPKTVAYTIEETRGKGVPDKMLGEHPSGVLVRDDYGSYTHLPMEQQSCWAHLLRNSRDMLKLETVSEEMEKLHTELTNIYAVLAAMIARPFDEAERNRNYVLLEKQITAIIGRRYRNDDVKKLQIRIKNQGTNLITALRHPDVPLTNNLAERMMRPMAVGRKISGGSRSQAGAQATAINMSIVQTIALKGQLFFERLAELLVAPEQKFTLERTE